ncbi:pirin-like C-terminal cupin domain-containing protein, partial [Stenotrophomonas sp. HMWF003]|uniref:pirin-like C-terminal cupin domain-containing protein n=1 Tax=Stenotrophomonas sp. HMWF003 TaxID=2056840 RepID=UPI00280B7E28
LNAGAHLTLPAIEGWTTVVVVLKGEVRLNAGDAIGPAQFAMFERHGQSIQVDAIGDATLLLLGGEPIDEPLVGHGPFVMNSAAEIAQAMADFNTGRFGQIPA